MNPAASQVKTKRRRRVGVIGGREVPGTGAPLSANMVRAPTRPLPAMGTASPTLVVVTFCDSDLSVAIAIALWGFCRQMRLGGQ